MPLSAPWLPWPFLEVLCKFRPELVFWFIIIGSLSAESNLSHSGVQSYLAVISPFLMSPALHFHILEISRSQHFLYFFYFSTVTRLPWPLQLDLFADFLPVIHLFMIAGFAWFPVSSSSGARGCSLCNLRWMKYSIQASSAAMLYQPKWTPHSPLHLHYQIRDLCHLTGPQMFACIMRLTSYCYHTDSTFLLPPLIYMHNED